MRLLLHHQEYQVRINSMPVTALTDQTIEPRSASTPATFFLSGFRDRFSVFEFDTIDTAAIDKDRHRTTLVPNTRRRLRCAIGFDASAAFQIDPGGLVVNAVCRRFLRDYFRNFEVVVV